ncbi:cobalt ECF transporter T component CbiQ [Desulfobacca acetoxidans]|uniref:Cobalt ABC transporter, inner membrane subunit CbiQ n=1 Tax=Desulfobacca acetoxidans (strain ATCC 700848 / DSM 11109 / ASRB2) TaxID=880072 RepID=F2NHB5_DESAR|nr:cobalt ECF transporter T component CbiQ [Desulfobacca acetoxidans]AEB08957.1 cobalt ABC transporter, inner membrane subunit CbiQ [Desulfobacca acetoxidans DSM 11109]
MSPIQESFSEGASLAHRLDPRGKIVVAALFAVLLAVSQSYVATLGGLGLALIWLALARLPLKQVAGRLLLVNTFIIFLWIILPVTYPGEPLGQIGPLTVSRQGLIFTGLITLKSNAIIIGLIALIATVPIVTLGQAMHNLRLPEKLCHLLLFTYRYLYVFEQEFHRLVQAMKVRGFQPRTNLHTYRSYAYLAAMLLVRSYDRADRVFQAMLCRGFHGVFYSLRSFSWHRRDVVFVTVSLLALVAVLFLEWRTPHDAVRI